MPSKWCRRTRMADNNIYKDLFVTFCHRVMLMHVQRCITYPCVFAERRTSTLMTGYRMETKRKNVSGIIFSTSGNIAAIYKL